MVCDPIVSAVPSYGVLCVHMCFCVIVNNTRNSKRREVPTHAQPTHCVNSNLAGSNTIWHSLVFLYEMCLVTVDSPVPLMFLVSLDVQE